MIYFQSEAGIKEIVFPENENEDGAIGKFLWADLLNMDHQRESNIERLLKINIPSPSEINDIEVSTRLYSQDNVLYMTASLMIKSDTDTPELHGVTFVLMPQSLVTVRYCDPMAFQNTRKAICASKKNSYTALEIFCILLEAAIERLADVIENVEKKIDVMGKKLFQPSRESFNFQEMLQCIGQQGDRVSKTHESLVTLGRMISFTLETLSADIPKDSHSQLVILSKDIIALNEHTTFISNKINFLLDATLGLINIEQNKIIKIFSVGTVIFSPPTLIASIYGMNFHMMPELSWHLGYPFALGLMLVSSISSYRYFKQRRWL